MKAAEDAIITKAIKRTHEPHVVGALLAAEIADCQSALNPRRSTV